MMNSRERTLTALAHQEPDRVPIDLGRTGKVGEGAERGRIGGGGDEAGR
ncbi:MAG: hypothetical protein GY832_44395 [Chloroflexi bacterium]|nr:hypothetical protein [Chloroflexota bacterium]